MTADKCRVCGGLATVVDHTGSYCDKCHIKILIMWLFGL